MAERIVTVQPTTGDYETLSAALAGEDGYNCVSNAGALRIRCANFQDTALVNFTSGTGITTSETYPVIIEAIDDHGGKYSTSSYRLENTGFLGGNLLTIAQQLIPDLYLKGLQLYNNSTSNLCTAIKSTGTPTSGTFKMEKCIVIIDDDVDDALVGVRLEEANINYYIWNSIIYGANGNTGSYGIQHVPVGGGCWIYNTTVDNVATGIQLNGASGAVVRMKNSRITNVTTVLDTGGATLHADSDYNLTDNATPPTNWGTNSLDSTDTPTIDHVDDSNATLKSRDYHLGATDSGLGAGTDLSSDTDNPFSDDIDGDTRSAWDIGADEAGGAIARSSADTFELGDLARPIYGGTVKIIR